jgi:hypothetical protein
MYSSQQHLYNNKLLQVLQMQEQQQQRQMLMMCLQWPGLQL